MGIHDNTRFNIPLTISRTNYLFKICYMYFPINWSHKSFCMVSFYFLSVFQRATFGIVIHVHKLHILVHTCTRSRSKADPAPLPPSIFLNTHFLYFLCSLSYFVFKNPLLHLRICQLPWALPPGPPLGVSKQPPAFYCVPATIRNSWIRHCRIHFPSIIISMSGCWNMWMFDLDANLDMMRLAMGFYCMVDISLSYNSWENSYWRRSCTMWSLTNDMCRK
jgi:hypothetical protein